MGVSLTKKYLRGEIGPVVGNHQNPNVVTLTVDEFKVVEGVVRYRQKANQNVVDQAASDDCRELEAHVAEFCVAKYYNVFPDFQWTERRKAELMFNGIPIDVKTAGHAINIRWNEQHQKASLRTVYIGARPLAINRCEIVGGIARSDLRDDQKKVGRDGVPYYQVSVDELSLAMQFICQTVPQWQTNEQWLRNYDD